MGSWLSGRHPLYPSDDLSDCIVLDAASLQGGRCWWKAPRYKSGAHQGLVEVSGISRSGRTGILRLKIWRRETSSLTATTQEIPLQAIDAPFGGLRWYFVCPSSRRLSLKLYLPAGCIEFASRRAYNLAYQVGRENDMDRAHRKLGALFAKLGLRYDGPETAFARRPKGMHRRTFARIELEIAAAEERLEKAYQAGLTRISRRLEKLGGSLSLGGQ